MRAGSGEGAAEGGSEEQAVVVGGRGGGVDRSEALDALTARVRLAAEKQATGLVVAPASNRARGRVVRTIAWTAILAFGIAAALYYLLHTM